MLRHNVKNTVMLHSV